MAQLACPIRINCEGSDFPITNYSSEGPEDPQRWYAVLWPLEWNAMGCLSVCTSNVSQEDADLCALQQQALCVNPDAVRVCNTPQTCSQICADGTNYFYTAPANLFCGTNQATVDAQAHAYACEQALLNIVCLGDIPSCACFGVAYAHQISVNGGTATGWSVQSGSFPPGITMDTTGNITGIPTAGGVYIATIRVTLSDGNYCEKDVTIQVIKISVQDEGLNDTTLADATKGFFYSNQFIDDNGAPVTSPMWSVVSGTLPAGLSLDANTGVISGTPTTSGTKTFTIQVSGTVGPNFEACFCNREFRLTVIGTTVYAYFKLDETS